MRKMLPIFIILSALLFVCPAAAYASDAGALPQSSRVNITVVMPDISEIEKSEEKEKGAEENENNSETEDKAVDGLPDVQQPLIPIPAPLLYPVSVDEVNENGGRSIVKVYELSPGENPAHISREPFERDGWNYALTDIIKAETAFADSKEHTETVTLNTDTKDTAAILSKLEPTMAYESEDGFVGVLALDVASVKVEQAGTKTNTFTMTETREYPQLSAPDTSLVPKTISSGGSTYKLANVDWRSGNNEAVDYEALPEYYTAVASYTATGSKTVVTGYVTSAEYTGSIGRITEGKTVYTAYFLGTEVVPEKTPLEFVSGLPSSVTDTEADTEAPPETPAQEEPPKAEGETVASAAEQTAANPLASEDSAADDVGLPGTEAQGSTVLAIVSIALAALIIGGGIGYIFTKNNNMNKEKKKGGAAHE